MDDDGGAQFQQQYQQWQQFEEMDNGVQKGSEEAGQPTGGAFRPIREASDFGVCRANGEGKSTDVAMYVRVRD
jgi:hypothetical protein